MAEPPARPPARTRGARLALAGYLAFVVYGSFFPFDFTLDPAIVRQNLGRMVVDPFDAHGRRQFSLTDAAANVLLGVPVGLLLVRGGLVGRGALARAGGAGAFALLFAAAVEAGQLLTPSRTASLIDVVAQTGGAVGGALAGHLALLAFGAVLGRRARLALRARPSLAVVAVLAAVLAADALYPFAVTLDVSTAWGNLKSAQLVPFRSLARGFPADAVVEKFLPYVGMGAAARLALAGTAFGAGGAWGLATVFAGALEVGKLLIVGRAPNVDGVLLASAGALLGAVVVLPATRLPLTRAHGPALLTAVAAALLIYEELTPFDFILSLAAARAKMLGIEWILFASYYGADLQSPLFDLGKKLLLGGFLGVGLEAGRRRAPWLWGLALGTLAETAQVFQASHVPSVTDVGVLAAGTALGARLVRGYRVRAALRVSRPGT